MTRAAAGPATVYERLRQELLAELDRQRVDPDADPARVTAIVHRLLADYERAADLGAGARLRDRTEMATRLLESVTAYGPLTRILGAPDVEEIFVEGARVTYLDRSGRLHGLGIPTTEEENRAVIARLLEPTGRSIDTRSPLVQARVLEGAARLSVAIPPIAESLSATIRRHAQHRHTIDGLVASGSLSRGAGRLLGTVMRGWSSILVSGQPGAGKTSLLTALLGEVPPDRCVRVCEEIRELTVHLTHGSCYETRPPSATGDAEVDLRQLVRFCLGMRTELLVVGEVRGPEAFELTRAVNAGCGFAGTVHANSARDALDALTNAAIMAGENVPESLVRNVFSASIDLVVHTDLHDRGDRSAPRREVREVVAVLPPIAGSFAVEPLFTRPDGPGTPLRWTGIVPTRLERFARCLPPGTTLRDVLADDEAELEVAR